MKNRFLGICGRKFEVFGNYGEKKIFLEFEEKIKIFRNLKEKSKGFEDQMGNLRI
jgi:hypothetical protein